MFRSQRTWNKLRCWQREISLTMFRTGRVYPKRPLKTRRYKSLKAWNRSLLV